MTFSQVNLFRHCVRSTKQVVDFHDDELYGNYSTNPMDYLDMDDTGSEKFSWGVPEEWCTPVGLDIMRGTGRSLGKSLLQKRSSSSSSSSSAGFKIRILSDIAERDVQSALALSTGLAEVLGTSSVGGAELILDPDIFNPFVPNNYTKTTLCSKKPSPAAVEAEIQARFESAPPPPVSMQEAVDILNKYATLLWEEPTASSSSSSNNSSATNETTTTTWTLDEHTKINGHDFTGLPNLLKHYAEMSFYSQASKLDPPFLGGIMTVDDTYDLLSWSYYMRYVANANNTYVAARGAVMADTVLKALGEEATEMDAAGSEEEEENTITIIVGHDGDLGALSTAMGLRWTPPLSSTYRFTDWQMTPPGSGISFTFDRDDQELQAQFVYPKLLEEDGTVDTTGALQYSAIHWTHTMESKSKNDTTSSTSMSTTEYDGISGYLNARVQSILSTEYRSEALMCYQQAQNRTRPFQFANEDAPFRNNTSSSNITIVEVDDPTSNTSTGPTSTLPPTVIYKNDPATTGYVVSIVMLSICVCFFGLCGSWFFCNAPSSTQDPSGISNVERFKERRRRSRRKAKGSDYTSAIHVSSTLDDDDYDENGLNNGNGNGSGSGIGLDDIKKDPDFEML